MCNWSLCFLNCFSLQVRGDSTSLDRGETVTFDGYQNTVGLALSHILTKFSWTHLREAQEGRGGGGKTLLQPLISVLSWQLATVWDTVQRVRQTVFLVLLLDTIYMRAHWV